jgi:hypothetical protein
MPGDGIQPWMIELAKMLILKDLPTGVILGSAVIEACKPVASVPSSATGNLQLPTNGT